MKAFPSPPPDASFAAATRWVGLTGRWSFDGATASFREPVPTPQDPGVGVAVCDIAMRTGWLRVSVTLDDRRSAAQLLFGRDVSSSEHYQAGIGGPGPAYKIDRVIAAAGVSTVASAGDGAELDSGREYTLDLAVRDRRVALSVDGVEVVAAALPEPPVGSQVGVVTWSRGGVVFRDLRVLTERPRAFVVMQFGGIYDILYESVIAPTCERLGFCAERADDATGPGVILNDIVASLTEADLIIAEITPANPNVFYELGYAHALRKPAILLAERGRKLPFDISGYRCVFYDNTIDGKGSLESSLERHLASVLTT